MPAAAVRRRVTLLLLPLLLLTLLAGCQPPPPQTRTTTRLVMGTLVNITTWNVPDPQEREAVAAAFHEMERVEAAMSSHRAESPVSRINQGGEAAGWQPVTEELAGVIAAALAIQEASGGAFDPGLAPLTRLWGFSRVPPPEAPPAAEALARWRVQRSGGGVALRQGAKGPQVRLTAPGVGLDLGGIAKGYAIDRAVETLRRQGVANAIVNAGGDLRVLGAKGNKPWRIGIQHPRAQERVLAVSELRGDRAMVTSGDYERFFLYQGRRYHHLLDPANGAPARAGVISVSVQAADAMHADALATAVMVLGWEKGAALLARFPGVEGLVVTEAGEVAHTPGFIGEALASP